MNIERRAYGADTYLDQSFPWGMYSGGAAICADGKVRTLKRIAQTADTFFSVPASVTVAGRTVSGYVTTECLSGSSVYVDDNDPLVVKFVAYSHGRNGHLLPGTTYRQDVAS